MKFVIPVHKIVHNTNNNSTQFLNKMSVSPDQDDTTPIQPPPTYDASTFAATICQAPSYRLDETDFGTQKVNDLVNLKSVKIQRKSPKKPLIKHPLFLCACLHNVSEKSDWLDVRSEDGKLLFKVETMRSIKIVMCVGNLKMNIALRSVDSNELHGDHDDHENAIAIKKKKKIAKIENKAHICSGAAGQIVRLKNSNGDVIGKLSKEQFDGKWIGRGDNRRIQYDIRYIICDSDDNHIYTIRGEERFFTLKNRNKPIKKFWIYDVVSSDDSEDKLVKTGQFMIRTSPTGGCMKAWEADTKKAHTLNFPSHANWEKKILLLMLSMVIEMEFTDRTALCPGC